MSLFQLCEQGGLGGDVVRYGAVDNDIKIARCIRVYAGQYEFDGLDVEAVTSEEVSTRRRICVPEAL